MFHWLAFMWLVVAAPEPLPAADQVQVTSRQESDGTHTLVHEVVVDAPAREVWAAISTPEGWQTWAAPVARRVAGQTNVIETSYTLGAAQGDATTIRQDVLVKVPERLLVFRTSKAPEGFPNFDTFRAVTSIFEVEPMGTSRSRVRLTTTGYADTEAGRQLVKFFRGGNRVSLEQLRVRFAKGPIDWTSLPSRRR